VRENISKNNFPVLEWEMLLPPLILHCLSIKQVAAAVILETVVARTK
jgi:hypothetical protein